MLAARDNRMEVINELFNGKLSQLSSAVLVADEV